MASQQVSTYPALAVDPLSARVERSIEHALSLGTGQGCPPRLAQCMNYAVFPGGGRLRPNLAIRTAVACGDVLPSVADAAGAAIELLHCASLVHDDMPCFDGADMRRGRPSVHRVFGDALALLTGDALIVLAFEHLAREVGTLPSTMAVLLVELARSAGATQGIVAGQAWESEPHPPIDAYHRAKTASLFAAAAAMGAIAGGGEVQPWRRFGEEVGRAYQLADDISDASGDSTCMGKPVGRDRLLNRPTSVRSFGIEGARARAASLMRRALSEVPSCSNRDPLVRWVERLASRIV